MAIKRFKSGKNAEKSITEKVLLKKYYLKSEESPEEPIGTFLRAVTP